MNLNINNMDNPYFNKCSFNISNISQDMEKYIKLVEELNNIQFIRYYNNIKIDMKGYSKTPVITGIVQPSFR